MGGVWKLLTSMNSGIFTLSICCAYFLIMVYVPATVRLPVKNLLLAVLCLNTLICVVSRCRGLTKKFKVKKAGSILFHTGIAVVIAAGLWSGQGKTGDISIGVQETLDLTEKGYPITIRAEDIRAEYYPAGSVKQYLTTLSFLENGVPVETRTLTVNHPVRYQGIKIYQSTYQLTPQGAISGLSVKTEPKVPLAAVGFIFLAAGSVLTLLRSR